MSDWRDFYRYINLMICMQLYESMHVCIYVCMSHLNTQKRFQEFGAEDALLLGGSADVNLWVRDQTLQGGRHLNGGNWICGPARKGGTRRSMFEEGERPLNCVIMAYLR